MIPFIKRFSTSPSVFVICAVLVGLVSGSCAKMGLQNELCFNLQELTFPGVPGIEEGEGPVVGGTIDYPFSYDIGKEVRAAIPDLSKDVNIEDLSIEARISEIELEAVEGLSDFSFIEELKFYVSDPTGELDEAKVLDYTYDDADEDDGFLIMESEEEIDLAKYLQVEGPLNFRVRVKGTVPLQKWTVRMNICVQIDSDATVSVASESGKKRK